MTICPLCAGIFLSAVMPEDNAQDATTEAQQDADDREDFAADKALSAEAGTLGLKRATVDALPGVKT